MSQIMYSSKIGKSSQISSENENAWDILRPPISNDNDNQPLHVDQQLQHLQRLIEVLC